MKAILVNYNFLPEWLKDYPQLEVTIFDRSDDGVERDLIQYGTVYKTRNMGDVDYDKISYLIDNYDNLPDVFLWGKTNIFKYVDQESFDAALEKGEFAPLLRPDHRIYGDRFSAVNYYQGGLYHERADSWFFNAGECHEFHSWEEWCSHFMLPLQGYIPFPPGGNFILTKERVHRYAKDFYEEMRRTLPYSNRPANAQAAERSYYMMFR